MDANNFLKGSAYIKRQDLGPDGERDYTIHDVAVAEFKDQRGATEQKLQLVLDDGARLTLNATNLRALTKALSPDTAQWTGRSIRLWFDEGVMYAGRVIGGIRLRVLPSRTAPTARPAVAPTGTVDPELGV